MGVTAKEMVEYFKRAPKEVEGWTTENGRA